jgi:DNA polymerase III sliding clamp (beta) subunit (PCNA family)
VNGKVKKSKEERALHAKAVNIRTCCFIRVDGKTYFVDEMSWKRIGRELILTVEERAVPSVQEMKTAVNWWNDLKLTELTGPGKSVTFKVEELKQCLAKLSKVAAARSQEPIYANVRFFTADNIVNLQAVDSDMSLTLKTDARADGTLDFLLELSELQKIVSTLMTVETTITLSESEATISAKDFSGKLKLKDSTKFIDLPIIQAIPIIEDLALDGIVLPLPGLKKQLEKVMFAIPKFAQKFVSTAALIETGDGRLTVVATDTKMMAVTTVKNDLLTSETSMTINISALKQLVKLDGGTTVRIADMDGQFVFATDQELLTHGKTHSEFPPYKKIFTKLGTFKSKITFSDKDKLISVLKRHNSLSTEVPACIEMTADGTTQQLSMAAINTERQATGDVEREVARDVINVEVTDAFTLRVDPNRLISFLERAAFPVTMYFYGPRTIVDFHANVGTPDNPTDRFLLLPLRIDDPAPAPKPTSVDDKVPAVIT